MWYFRRLKPLTAVMGTWIWICMDDVQDCSSNQFWFPMHARTCVVSDVIAWWGSLDVSVFDVPCFGDAVGGIMHWLSLPALLTTLPFTIRAIHSGWSPSVSKEINARYFIPSFKLPLTIPSHKKRIRTTPRVGWFTTVPASSRCL